MNTPAAPSYAHAQARRLTELVAGVDHAVHKGMPADEWLARVFKENRSYGSKDRRLIASTVFSFFRWRGWVAPRQPVDYAQASAMAYALDNTAPHPVMEHLTPDNRSYAPVGDRPIHDKADEVARWQNLSEPPTLHALAPPWIPEALGPIADRVLESMQERPPLWIRLRRDAPCPPGFTPHPHLPHAARSPHAVNRRELEKTYDIQDLASQCVGWICGARPDKSWWDVCAGAGGKTLHLADRMQSKGHILATDVRVDILRELARRARTAGVDTMIRTRPLRSGVPSKKQQFDGVLVDAPCSGLGTWSRNPDARWRITRTFVETMAGKQNDILTRAAPHVRPGGCLMYAVCTLTRAETIAIRKQFEETHPHFVPDRFSHPLHQTPCEGEAWIYPWDGPCEGMFIARWTRQK